MSEAVPGQLAVIGGTGIQALAGFETDTEHRVDTPFGAPSGVIREGLLAGRRCLFLARHGVPHQIPPHRINYRANLWALRQLGADAVLGVNAVGGINPAMPTGRLVIPDQVVDYTWGRKHTFFDGENTPGELTALEHIDFTEPYHPALRRRLADAAQGLGLEVASGGTYAATQGPRLESAAEVRRLAQDGCDIVGMTGMPEAALAAELGMAYASLCIVVNAAAGLGDEPITLEAMGEVLALGAAQVAKLLQALVAADG